MHRLGAFEHRQRRQQPHQSETMVAVQMGDEDVVQPAGTDAEALHSQQHALTAIDEEELVAQFDQLPRGRGRLRRLRTTAA